jgi:hypothetical protein
MINIKLMKIHILLVAAFLCGCGTVASTKIADKTMKITPHSEPVCFIRAPLSSDVKYTVIGELKSNKRTYGTVAELIPVMAKEARSVGADAIINIETGQKFSVVAWAKPVGSGQAIKLDKREGFDCVGRSGEWH